MTENDLTILRERVSRQQSQVDILLQKLVSGSVNTLPEVDKSSVMIEHRASPQNFKELRQKYCEHYQDIDQVMHWIKDERESPGSLFLKLSQLMIKWSEVELAILKELGKQQGEQESAVDEVSPLSQSEREWLKEYLNISDQSAPESHS